MHFSRGRLKRLGLAHGAFKPVSYYDYYEEYLELDPNEITNVLELGIHEGGSLLMWRDFFPTARIFGVDLGGNVTFEGIDRIHTLQADQTDGVAIGGFLVSHGVETLDLIVDDCSHIGLQTKQSFELLFDDFLKPGGHYVIEDWGTGYWQHWADGADLKEPDARLEMEGVFQSHLHGIPGFIKQLVDRIEMFDSLVITGPFVVAKKRTISKLDSEKQ